MGKVDSTFLLPDFEEMSKIADRHTRSYGKVSTSTGASAALKGEFFGAGFSNDFTGQKLYQAIESKYGDTLANSVARQLGLQIQGNKPINSYKVAKAVALVKDWTKVRTTEINYEQVDESGNATKGSTKCTVTLTPLGQLKSLANSLGVFGVSSTDRNNMNVVNGWIEQMSIGAKNNSVSLLRSGMLVPPNRGDEIVTKNEGEHTEREEIALKRYKQILSAIVETTSSLSPLDFDEEKNNQGNPLEIEHAHIGLISTNDLKKPGELEMAKEQLAFLKNHVNGKSVEIDYVKPGTNNAIKIWIKPKVLYTNFSVQKANKKQRTEENQFLLGSELSPDAQTEQTLDHYLGAKKEDGALLGKINTLPAGEQEEARALFNRLVELRSTRAQEGSSFYSYEFQTKYSLLLAKCGIPTHVYCKSGKDRTSRFSEMIKMWAANPELTLNNMTRAVRNVIKAFSFSGNATVQRLNTGFAGNKQFKTYWRLIAGEKKDRTFGGWTHWLSAGSYSGWGASTIVKT